MDSYRLNGRVIDRQVLDLEMLLFLKTSGSELRGNLIKLLQSNWVSERLGLIDRVELRLWCEAYLQQSSRNGRVGLEDILAPVALELWARRFENYLSASVILAMFYEQIINGPSMFPNRRSDGKLSLAKLS